MITPDGVSITDLLFSAALKSSAASLNAVILIATRRAFPATSAKVNAPPTAWRVSKEIQCRSSTPLQVKRHTESAAHSHRNQRFAVFTSLG